MIRNMSDYSMLAKNHYSKWEKAEMGYEKSLELILFNYYNMIYSNLHNLETSKITLDQRNKIQSHIENLENQISIIEKCSADFEKEKKQIQKDKEELDSISNVIRYLNQTLSSDNKLSKNVANIYNSFDKKKLMYLKSLNNTKEAKELESKLKDFPAFGSIKRSDYSNIVEYAEDYKHDVKPDSNNVESYFNIKQKEDSYESELFPMILFTKYQMLPDNFKSKEVNQKELEETLSELNKASFSINLVDESINSLQELNLYGIDFFGKSQQIDFSSEINELYAMKSLLLEKQQNCEKTINDKKDIIKGSIEAHSLYSNNKNKYSKLYLELKKLEAQGAFIDPNDRTRMDNIRYEMESIKNSGILTMEDINDIEREINEELNPMRKTDKKDIFDFMPKSTSASIISFMQSNPNEYEQLKNQALATINAMADRGDFGDSMLSAGSDVSNPDFIDKYSKAFETELQRLIDEYIATKEIHNKLEEAGKEPSQIEFENQTKELFGEYAVQNLKDRGMINETASIYTLNSEEKKLLHDTINDLKKMSTMNEIERSLYRATSFPYKDSKGNIVTLIPKREDGSEVTLDSLTPMEKAQLRAQLESDRRHPEFDQLLGEYVAMEQEYKESITK